MKELLSRAMPMYICGVARAQHVRTTLRFRSHVHHHLSIRVRGAP